MGFLSSDADSRENEYTAGTQTSNAPAVTVNSAGKGASSNIQINQESPEALALAGSLGKDSLGVARESLASLERIASAATTGQGDAVASIEKLTKGFTETLSKAFSTRETGGANLVLDSVKWLPQIAVVTAGGILGLMAYKAVK